MTRVVTPDGNITNTNVDGSTTSMLSEEDQETLFGILSSDEFITAMTEGFVCPDPPTDIGISFTLVTVDSEYMQSVTGCATGATEPVATIQGIMNSYDPEP